MKLGKRIPWNGTGLCECCGKELRTTAFRTIDGGTFCSRKCAIDDLEYEMRALETLTEDLFYEPS